jgi:hypothetical protein
LKLEAALAEMRIMSQAPGDSRFLGGRTIWQFRRSVNRQVLMQFEARRSELRQSRPRILDGFDLYSSFDPKAFALIQKYLSQKPVRR